MIARFIIVVVCFVMLNQVNSQVLRDEGFGPAEMDLSRLIPNSDEMRLYYDSLQGITSFKLITGVVSSSLNELTGPVEIKAILGDNKNLSTYCDERGRFYFDLPVQTSSYRIFIENVDYKLLDTTFLFRETRTNYLNLTLSPRYKILLRARTYARNMPIEGVDVELEHLQDTFRTTTLSCYIDEEEYWNCLYLGMFKQPIRFDNPEDSVLIKLSKPGYKSMLVPLVVGEYDGRVMDIKLQYAEKLPYFPKHNIGINFGLPFSDDWVISLDYMNNIKIGKFDRLALGAEIAMQISDIEFSYPTLSGIETVADSSYTLSFAGPKIAFWLTDPTKRSFSVYTGVSFPNYFSGNNKSFGESWEYNPFIGGRFYLDLNKSLIFEVRSISYNLNKVEYEFNPFGNAKRTISDERYSNKLLIKLGVQVSF